MCWILPRMGTVPTTVAVEPLILMRENVTDCSPTPSTESSNAAKPAKQTRPAFAKPSCRGAEARGVSGLRPR
jgi:hypothetical protein